MAASLSTLGSCEFARREVGDRLDDHEPSLWTSADDCDALLSPPDPGARAPRIGTWNLLYFPDAQADTQDDEDRATNVAWLACTLASLGVDILAVQEVKQSERAQQKQRELITRLNELTGGDWRLELAPCRPLDVQHPGFLFDARRVTATHLRELPELSPEAECSNDVSPGFAGYFAIQGGPDFHLVAVHMEAYTTVSGFESRADSIAAMAEVVNQARSLVPDSDIVFAGDFNTTGCEDCEPAVSASEETLRLAREVKMLEVPLTLVPADLPCSKPGGALLDHFVVDESLGELPAGAVAQVGGICAETECSRLREWHEQATERVSDHCPLTLELTATDDD